MLFVGGLLSLFFIALATMPRSFCIDCGMPERIFYVDASSSVRMLDCSSVALNRGPYLPAETQAELMRIVEERYPRNPAFARWDKSIVGELRYSARGELEAISVQASEGHIRADRQLLTHPSFRISSDSSAFNPLKSRAPFAVCDGPTLVTFRCVSEGSQCQLSAAPA